MMTIKPLLGRRYILLVCVLHNMHVPMNPCIPFGIICSFGLDVCDGIMGALFWVFQVEK